MMPHFVVLMSLMFCFAQLVSELSAAPDDERPIVSDAESRKDAPATRPSLPTIFFVGDSTLNNNAPLRGWANEVGGYFDTSKINIINRAIAGRSSKTYMNEGRWDRVLAEVKPGDFVVVQFGHNDVGRYDDPAGKFRPSLHGEGDETAELDKGDGVKEVVHTFGWYMRKYASDARARGATVILCSMVPHKDWSDDGTQIKRGERASFVVWTRNAAAATGSSFIDLNEISATGMERLGQAEVEKLFGDKRTHTTVAGARFNARCFIAGLNALDPNPLAAYLSTEARAVEPADKSLAAAAPTTVPSR